MFKLAIPVKKQLTNLQRRNAMSFESKETNQAQRTSQIWSPSVCVEYCTFWQLTTKGRTPVQLTVRRRILRSCRSVGNSLLSATEPEELENSEKKCRLHVPKKATIIHWLAPPKTGCMTCSLSQHPVDMLYQRLTCITCILLAAEYATRRWNVLLTANALY
jgi:hypothetical protein